MVFWAAWGALGDFLWVRLVPRSSLKGQLAPRRSRGGVRQPLYCAADATCRPLGEAGEPCTTSSECRSKICDLPAGHCADYTVDRCVDG